MFWNPEDALLWANRVNPKDVEMKFDLMAAEVRKLMAGDQVKPAGATTWYQSLEKSFHWPPKVIEDVDAAILRDDIAAVVSSDTYNIKFLDEIGQYIASKSPGPQMTRQWEVRKWLFQSVSGADHVAWRRYLAGWSGMPPVSDQSHCVLEYLRARRANSPKMDAAMRWEAQLESSIHSPEVYRQWIYMTAQAYLENGQYQVAAKFFEKLAILSSGESALLAREHARKAIYFERGRLENRPVIK
jgi:hypothetical protein